MAKQKNSKAGAAKAPTVPAALVKQLAEIPDVTAREAGLSGLVSFYAPQLFPNKADSVKLTREHLESLIREHNEGAEHEEMLKSVEIDTDAILGGLTEEVQDILTGDATKRFVLTLRWDSTAGAFVLAKSIQTARGRKAKATDSADDSDAE